MHQTDILAWFSRYDRLQDRNNMALFLFDVVSRWTGFRVDLVSYMMIIITFILVVLIPGYSTSPAKSALALVYAINVGIA